MSDPQAADHESNDNHVYNSIFVYKETFDLLLKSLHFYRDLLRRAIDAVNVDDDLKALLDPDALQSSPAQKELKRVENAIKWWEQLREREGADAFDYNIGSFSHGGVCCGPRSLFVTTACSLITSSTSKGMVLAFPNTPEVFIFSSNLESASSRQMFRFV